MEQLGSISRSFDEVYTKEDVVLRLKEQGFANITTLAVPHKAGQSLISASKLPPSCSTGEPCEKHAMIVYFRFENGRKADFSFFSGPHYE